MNLIRFLLPILLSNLVKGNSLKEDGCPEGQFKYDKDNSCYDLIFKATNEFQEVIPGQQIPKGLHVQMDFTTGVKRAKLDVSGETNVKPNLPQLELDAETLLKMGDAPRLNYYLNLIPNLNENEKLLTSLEGIEELSHDLEMGIKIASHKEGFNKLIAMLNPKYPTEIRILSLTVIGSALQNNLKASSKVDDTGIIPKLVDYLSMENLDQVTNRLLFTISSVSRTHQTNFKKFIDLGLLDTLYQQFKLESRSQTTLKKILVLLEDCFDLNLHGGDATNSNLKVNIKDKDVQVWSDSLQHFLAQDKNEFSLDFKSKLLNALDKITLFNHDLKCNKDAKLYFSTYKLTEDELEDDEFLVVFNRVRDWAKNSK